MSDFISWFVLNYFLFVFFWVCNIIIIKIESAVQDRERVWTLYQSEDPNPIQPTHGMKKKRK